MKKRYLILAMLLALGCTAPKENNTGKGSEEPASKDTRQGYAVTDTGRYADELTGGKFAVITHNKQLFDTIDFDFGLKPLGKNYIYLKLRGYTDPTATGGEKVMRATPDEYLIVNQAGTRTALKTLVPHFEDYFSSPSVIDGNIYYWSLKPLDSVGSSQVSAVQFNAANGKINVLPLFKDQIATDDRFYFEPPFLKDNKIFFRLNEKQIWSFNKDFQQID